MIEAAHEEANLVNEQVDAEKSRNPEQSYTEISEQVIARPEFQPRTESEIRFEEAFRESNPELYEALKHNDFKRAVQIDRASKQEIPGYYSMRNAQLESVFSSGNIDGIKSAFEALRSESGFPDLFEPYASYIDNRIVLQIPPALRKEQFVQDQIRERIHDQLQFPKSLKRTIDVYRQSGFIDDAFMQDPKLRKSANGELMYQLSHYYRGNPLEAAKYIEECAAAGIVSPVEEIKRDPWVRRHFGQCVADQLTYGDVVNGVAPLKEKRERARAFVEAVVATGIVDSVAELRKQYPVVDEVYKDTAKA